MEAAAILAAAAVKSENRMPAGTLQPGGDFKAILQQLVKGNGAPPGQAMVLPEVKGLKEMLELLQKFVEAAGNLKGATADTVTETTETTETAETDAPVETETAETAAASSMAAALGIGPGPDTEIQVSASIPADTVVSGTHEPSGIPFAAPVLLEALAVLQGAALAKTGTGPSNELTQKISMLVNQLIAGGDVDEELRELMKNFGTAQVFKEMKNMLAGMMENGSEPAELLKDILTQPAGKNQATLPGEKAVNKPELPAEAAKELSGQPVHVTSLHNTGQGTGETGNAAIMATNTEAAVKFADALPADSAKAPVNSLARWTEDILGRIGEKARIILGSGQSEMQIQLKPDFLGKVNLQVTMENGQMTARIGVENQQVKELVEANLKQLQQNLDNQGFKVSNLLVDLSANRQFHHFNRHHDYGSGQTVRLRNTGFSEGYDSPAVNDGVAAAGWKSMDSTVEYIA